MPGTEGVFISDRCPGIFPRCPPWALFLMLVAGLICVGTAAGSQQSPFKESPCSLPASRSCWSLV